MSDNEIYLLIKYIKSVLWRVAKRLSLYTEDARCLKVKPRERAFKQFKSPVLNVLKPARFHGDSKRVGRFEVVHSI